MSRALRVAARSPLRRLATRALAGRTREVRVISGPLRGTRMRLNLASEKSVWAGIYEPTMQAFLAREAPTGVAFDVGAHIGYFSLLLARTAQAVVAVEPIRANADRIRDAADRNNAPIAVIEAAAADRAGAATLDLGPTDSMAKLKGVSGPAGVARHASIAVPAVTLDDLAREHGRPELVKIDVEGAAALVLTGARALLEHRPTLVCEIHSAIEEEALRDAAARTGMLVEEIGGPWLVARARG